MSEVMNVGVMNVGQSENSRTSIWFGNIVMLGVDMIAGKNKLKEINSGAGNIQHYYTSSYDTISMSLNNRWIMCCE